MLICLHYASAAPAHNWTPFPTTLTGKPVSKANFITLLNADDTASGGATARIVNTITLEKNSPENTDANYFIWVAAATGQRFQVYLLTIATTSTNCSSN